MKNFLTAVCCFIFSTSFSNAATTPNSFVTPQTPNRGIVQFLQGTDSPGVAKTLYTSGPNGSRCYGGWVTSTDGASHPAYIRINNSGIDFGGAATNVGPTAGLAPGNPAVAWMTPSLWPGIPIDEYGNPYIPLNAGDTLKAVFTGSLGTGAAINFFAACSDF